MKLLQFVICLLTLIYSGILAADARKGICSYPYHQAEIIQADIDHYYHADDLWSELRQSFRLPHYENDPLVRERIQWFYRHPDYLQRSLLRAKPWLYFIMQETKKRNLPAELVLIPIIESAYNPYARNADSGATGIWQIRNASHYGVRQNWWYDGRRDVVASTHAALNHLSDLRSFFDGNWLLAIAAYDTGEGNVLSAIRHNIRKGRDIDFWSLPLAEETRDYVPRLLALASIIQHPELSPIDLPSIPNAPYLAEVDTTSQIDLKQAAALANLRFDELQRLNSGYNFTTTEPIGPQHLFLPIENVLSFSKNYAGIAQYPSLHWIRYHVQPGDTLLSVAEQFALTPDLIRKHNPKLGDTLQPGSQILVAQAAPPSTFNHPSTGTGLAETVGTFFKKSYDLQPGDTLYMVRKGDDIEKIATHFQIKSTDILALNQVNSNPLPGQILIIPTHQTERIQQFQLVPGDTIYVVKHHETLEEIANRFHTTPSQIRLANLMMDSHLTPGDRLVIPAKVG